MSQIIVGILQLSAGGFRSESASRPGIPQRRICPGRIGDAQRAVAGRLRVPKSLPGLKRSGQSASGIKSILSAGPAVIHTSNACASCDVIGPVHRHPYGLPSRCQPLLFVRTGFL